ncbi:MAG TPA: trehalose-6-phosphate synthase [Acidobacteriota bacterium]|nr:trehalose-6-phosphate synthase [Acidobacteriota bacterium]
MAKADEKREGRLVIVSNRLPVVLKKRGGNWNVEPGSGGLITALVPVLRDRGGLWIGWPGLTAQQAGTGFEQTLAEASRNTGYRLVSVLLTEQEKEGFYLGFSNEIVWPLFHDLQLLCNFDPAYWRTYRNVNQKFADAIAANCRDKDFIWVHDYHLMIVSRYLRDRGIQASVAFFLHTPFPPLDVFLKLPWRDQILRGLLSYGLVGLQTLRDRRNFLQCVENLVPDAGIEGNGDVVNIQFPERTVQVGVFPISIDFDDFAKRASSRAVERRVKIIQDNLANRKIALGVDRLDYTKGIPYRLRSFQNALDRYPDLRGALSLVQIIVPSRENIPRYSELKTEIDQLVGEINGKYTESGWIPVHYLFRSLTGTELLAYYRASEIALITPLKDGMNLVAKEYCAATTDDDGILILSEFAGAAAQMKEDAFLVNPYDIEGVADAIHEACVMNEQEKRRRMKNLRRGIKEQNIYTWVESVLRAGMSKELRKVAVLQDYLPQIVIR